jgi:transcriptional regulator with XRE-family HTH domain
VAEGWWLVSTRHVRYGGVLGGWRTRQGVSLRRFAALMGYSFSHISKIERGERGVSREFAERADAVLGAQGALITAWLERSSAVVRPRQLPPGTGRLVGRRYELSVLDDVLEGQTPGTPAVIVVDGPAGAGKTALALHWAHRTASRFADGQLYADLEGFSARGRPVDPNIVLDWFCAALAGSASMPKPPDTLEERAALYRSLVQDRRVLIVLDNAASAEQVEPLLPGADGCAVLMTSRRVLSRLSVVYDARRVTVGPLTPTESMSLIRDRVGAQRTNAEPDAVAELGQICGHLPLALRIAADLAQRSAHRSFSDLVNDLRDPAARLDTLAVEELALREVFSWSYRELPADAARTLGLLGLHSSGTLSMSALATLTNLGPTAASNAVRALAALHLVELRSSDIVAIPNLVRDYARGLGITDPDRHRAPIRRTS